MLDIVEANNHSINAVLLRQTLMSWGHRHFRAFPWRLVRTPYRVLMSEVMLHRTQATQVTPVYERFMQRYPDISSLARATRQELHGVLRPLGLHWRIDRVYEMAQELDGRFGAQVPHDKELLLSLPGISEYIASAVRCFAWDLPETLIDTNTVRITGRLFGLEIKDSSRRNRQYVHLMAALLDAEHPRDYSYALLDLAHEVCLGKRPPACDQCPIQRHCVHGNTEAIPEYR